MTACLAPQEIARYRAGDMKSEQELLAIEDHLDGCPACRQSLRTAISVVAPALRERLTSPVELRTCPEPTLLARYAEGRADTTDIELVRTHCEDCPTCAQDLTDRLAARELTAHAESPKAVSVSLPMWRQRLRALFLPNGLPSHPGIAACALVIVAALGALSVYRGMVVPLNARNQALMIQQAAADRRALGDRVSRGELEKSLRQSLQVRTEQEAHLQKLDAHLQELEARLTHLPRTTLSAPSAPVLAAVEQTMATGRSEIDPEAHRVLALMERESSTLRGGTGDPSGPALLQPIGTRILEERPTLRWNQEAGAQNYTVTIRRVTDANATDVHAPDPNEEQKGVNVTGTTWQVAKPLQRGKRYRWQVTTPDGGASSVGEFQVVDMQTAETLRHTTQDYSGRHLTLGILYARAGLLDAAEAEWIALPSTDPKCSIARALLQNLRALRLSPDPNGLQGIKRPDKR